MGVEKDTDPGFKNLQSIIEYMNGHTVKAGYIGDNSNDNSKNKRKNGKADNVLLATVHNYGSPQRKIPARPTMTPAFDKNQLSYSKMIDNSTMNAMNSKSKAVFNSQFGQVGMKMQQDIQTEIRIITQPVLKQATIKRKGSSKPLIDTGQMMQSTTFITGKNI